MISKEPEAPRGNKTAHKKHEDIARPTLGQFGRNEWAFLGTNCGAIKQLAFRLSQALSPQWRVAYVDADHQSADEDAASGGGTGPALAHGAALEFTDKISFQRTDSVAAPTPFQFRQQFSEADVVLVNGNHFTAKQQVVIVDPKKEDSLRRKLDRLTDVVLVLLPDGVENLPGFLSDHLGKSAPNHHFSILQLSDFQNIKSFFETKMAAAVPPLSGLVLAGGKSRRMGTDKSVLAYHDRPQRDVVLDHLAGVCGQSFLSCRPDQAGELVFSYDVLPDTFLGLGPMGAILSALRQQPDSAWLVLACDLPLLDAATIRFLVENRNPSAMATAFRSPESGFPEPLAAIWEPKSYPVLLQFLAQGYSCPRKALINSHTHLVEPPNPDALLNVNTPEEVETALQKLGINW